MKKSKIAFVIIIVYFFLLHFPLFVFCWCAVVLFFKSFVKGDFIIETNVKINSLDTEFG